MIEIINEILQWISIFYIIYVLLNLSSAQVTTKQALKVIWQYMRNRTK